MLHRLLQAIVVSLAVSAMVLGQALVAAVPAWALGGPTMGGAQWHVQSNEVGDARAGGGNNGNGDGTNGNGGGAGGENPGNGSGNNGNGDGTNGNGNGAGGGGQADATGGDGGSDGTEPVVEEPVVEEPVVEGPVVEGPVVEGPVVEGPVVEGPVVEGPVVEGPVVEEPLIEMPRLPVVNAPAVEAPVAPVVNPSAGAPMAAGPDPAVLLAAAPPTGGEAPVDLPAEGGLSASVHRVFDAFLPPAFVAVVVSPFVVLQALAEALSSSGLGLALPAAVFGLGLAGRRTRRWLLAYGRGDAPR